MKIFIAELSLNPIFLNCIYNTGWFSFLVSKATSISSYKYLNYNLKNAPLDVTEC